MSKIFGEVIATPGGPTPFAAVIKSDTRELTRAPVDTRQQGERLVVELLRKLEEFARSGFDDT